jgi:YidC/Oxa1 family membrane protein insertase
LDNQRNLAAVVLSLALLLGFDLVMGRLYPQPAPSERVTSQADTPAQQVPLEGGAGALAEQVRHLRTALRTPGRVAIDAPEVAGSINPIGAQIEDIVLKSHRQTVERDSGPVRVFSPAGTPTQQFAQFGWAGQGVALPGPETAWQVEGGPLAPGRPVVLSWENGQGQQFRIRYSIDEFYMLTVEQTIANAGTRQVAVRPYGFLNRTRRTADDDTFNVHAGPIGHFGDAVNFDWNYEDVAEERAVNPEGRAGWVGFTDTYWLSALVPQPGARTEVGWRSLGGDIFRADLIYDRVTVAPGRQYTQITRLFAGAKESNVLDHYEDAGVPNFGLAIDWGWFRWFMYPIFWLLKQLFAITGNFGVAIILLTVVVRALVFPIAQRGFASMAATRAVQPKMKAIQERHKDDRVKLQQEMAKLYKDEKINPLSGCLPLLLQIPIFFALYKTLLVAIEMRHKPFALWIKDLSAQDPATILNLFGLLPYDPPSFLSIGVLAALLGVTMWLQFKLNPAPMDPVQQQVFSIMPWVVMFAMAQATAGLLLYWVTSNILTLAQQKYLYSKDPQVEQPPAPSHGTAPHKEIQ